MAFNFQAYRNPYVSTIAELLSRGEDAKAKALIDVANAQARAAEIRGQAYGGAVQNIGQIASKALTDYTDPKRKLNDMALKQAESNARLDDATRDLLSQTMRPVITTTVPGVPFEASSVNVVPPTPQGMGSRAFGGVSFGAPVQPQASQPLFGRTEVGTQTVVPDSTFVQSQGPERQRFNDPGTGLFDINEVGKAYSNLRDKDGRPYSPAQIASRLEPIQKINESVLDFDAKQDSLEKSKQAAFGTMADGVIKYVEANGGSYINAARLAVTPWERRLGKDAVDTFLENFGKLSPTQQRGQLDVLRNQAASLLPQKTLAKDTTDIDAFGRVVARGPVGTPVNPTRASFLRDATDQTKTPEERAIAQKNADDLKPVAPALRNSDTVFNVKGLGNVPLTVELGPSGQQTRYFYESPTGRVEKFAGVDFTDKPQASAANSSLSDTTDTAQQLVDGNLVPSMLSRRGNYNDILAEANRISKKQTGKPYNAARAQTEFSGAQRFMSSLNGPQQQRFQALAIAVVNTIDEVKMLSAELNNSGVPILNRIKLAAYAQTQGETPNGQLAARYIGAVNTLKEEFANLANGGYAPTEAAWKLANQQINSNFGVKQMESSLTEVQRLINFRMQAFERLTPYGVSPDNPVLGEKGVVNDRIYYDKNGNPIGKP